jgi:hypothetical protein
MLGGFSKTVIGGATLGLVAAGLFAAVGPVAVHAAPGDDKACAIVTQDADVASVEPQHNAAQTSRGDWTDIHTGQPRPWYGLYYPGADPDVGHNTPRLESFGQSPTVPAAPVQVGDHFQWRLNGKCANSGFVFNSQGDAIGYCGRSVGLGVGTVGEGANARSYVVRWESVGSQLVLLDRSAAGSVNAQANAPGSPNGSCVSGTATRFTVDGGIVDTRA